MKRLLAGPWVGEFGWELFCWQAYIRTISKNYDETYIICRNGNEFLYKDFAKEFYIYDAPFSKSNMWLGEIDHEKINEIQKKSQSTHYIAPFNIGFGITYNDFIVSDNFNRQEFIKYNSNFEMTKYDILLHTRNKAQGHERNWSKENWQELVDRLLEKYSVAIIGGEESFELNNVDNHRLLNLESLVGLMQKTNLVVGQSSGPLHLASLCGTSHLVWSDSSNKLRYEKYWNPHKTKVYYYDKENWNPKSESIYTEIVKILK